MNCKSLHLWLCVIRCSGHYGETLCLCCCRKTNIYCTIGDCFKSWFIVPLDGVVGYEEDGLVSGFLYELKTETFPFAVVKMLIYSYFRAE